MRIPKRWPRWRIQETDDGQWMVVLVGGNGEPIEWGESHPTRDKARRAIDDAKRAAFWAAMRPVQVVERAHT